MISHRTFFSVQIQDCKLLFSSSLKSFFVVVLSVGYTEILFTFCFWVFVDCFLAFFFFSVTFKTLRWLLKFLHFPKSKCAIIFSLSTNVFSLVFIGESMWASESALVATWSAASLLRYPQCTAPLPPWARAGARNSVQTSSMVGRNSVEASRFPSWVGISRKLKLGPGAVHFI